MVGVVKSRGPYFDYELRRVYKLHERILSVYILQASSHLPTGDIVYNHQNSITWKNGSTATYWYGYPRELHCLRDSLVTSLIRPAAYILQPLSS